MACNLCGGESGKYYLCFKCNKLKEEGKVQKCVDCSQWYYVDKGCKCRMVKKAPEAKVVRPLPSDKISAGNGICIVCGENAPNGYLCRDCYYEMRDYKDSFDKNSKVFDMKDYYFNLRSNIYRMKTFDYIKSNCSKLMAIANFVNELYRDTSLTDRAVNDIKDIIESKKPKEETKVSEEAKEKDSHKEEIRRTCDGHYVKSDPEIIIDDILYENRIVHCYEKKVPIDSDEQTIKCDWFIPVLGSTRGIYIEYWGMKTPKYLKERAEKEKLYKIHNIPYIGIEADDPKKDTLTFRSNLIRDLTKLAEERYGFMPKWKK